ncbi:hypothetical protein [Halostella salina]|uniref:hypothetical protein n=1 Tax=Halostella salina TaxID=1547897 RepID=UPI000EF77C31|nr:hypothetical protein [Halostella salina]
MSEIHEREQRIVDGDGRVPLYVRFTSHLNDSCDACDAVRVAFRHPAAGLSTGKICYACGALQRGKGPPARDDDPFTDEEREYLDREFADLPRLVRNSCRSESTCPRCGSDHYGPRVGKLLSRTKMCYDCGFLESEPSAAGSGAGTDDGKSRDEARADASRNAGKMLQIVGLLFTLTVVGAIVGIPLLVLGMHIEARSIDGEEA